MAIEIGELRSRCDLSSMRGAQMFTVSEVEPLLDRIDRMEKALRQLETWDMLYLDPETGRGAATADAPWARALIREALS